MTHTDANSSDALRSLQMTEFGELAASLVHDLGQSIAAVHAAGELLESRLDSLNVPDDVKRMIKIVARAGHDLCRQHAVIRNFARHRQAGLQQVALGEMVEAAAQVVRGAVHGDEVQLEVITDADCGSVSADPGLTQLAIVTLLTRSFKIAKLAPRSDRRMMLRHQTSDGGQEVILEFSLPASDYHLPPQQYESTQRIMQLQNGSMTIEHPADGVVHCRLYLPG